MKPRLLPTTDVERLVLPTPPRERLSLFAAAGALALLAALALLRCQRLPAPRPPQLHVIPGGAHV